MTAGYDPQAAAQQAGKNYRDVTAQLGLLGLDTSVPEAVRAMAEKTVARTREVYDRSKDALDASIVTFERTFDAAGQGAAAFNRKIIDIAQRNVDASFDLATSLAGAKNLAEIVKLQAAHWRKQLRCIDGPGRGSPRAVDEGDGRCGRADQVAHGARRGWGEEGALKLRCRSQ